MLAIISYDANTIIVNWCVFYSALVEKGREISTTIVLASKVYRIQAIMPYPLCTVLPAISLVGHLLKPYSLFKTFL